mmetsp:Transcript_32165/g.70176  ORF Transcript_32165/g.70176 Transcript_32165/m.70176 type:complete len:340 (-) Transcript_32165:410-1429(-)|eukprot:CAMPEP_0118956906 /NCGR_PEP_ID=MMETSP1169-20130426/61820_1 /TAXON_ID=36882 /ORGANISM="Pyramimonas obovata, Strain CCMP722" /LENGTH=339 /DNA_ID=CAMNT_0006904955 /DNA_START=83 /DNA_END=1102 /DNA_ORIENTATION=+
MATDPLQDVSQALALQATVVAVPGGEADDTQKAKPETPMDAATSARLNICLSLLQKNLRFTWATVRKNAPCWAFFIPTGDDTAVEPSKETKTQSITCLLCKTFHDGVLPDNIFPTEGEFALSDVERNVNQWLPQRGKEGKYIIEYNSRHSTAKLTWHLSACHKHVWESFLQLHGETSGVKRSLSSQGKSIGHAHSGGIVDGGALGAKFREDVTFEGLRLKVAQFAAERDWDQFHTPRNLMLALVGEVGELSEIFQWRGEVPRGLPDWSRGDKEHLGEELSDVLVYLMRLADVCGIDLPSAALDKITKNEKKYPADKCRGSSAKYTVYDPNKRQKAKGKE